MGREHPDRDRTKKPPGAASGSVSRAASGSVSRARAALTIAGLDPSGGAGITADLRGFRAAGVWGASVCAVLTVQSTKGLAEAHAVPAKVVRASAVQCLVDLDVRAMKSGALGSEENVRAVAELFAECREIPSIVDPVMAPTRAVAAGARLDGSASNEAVWALVRAATLVTPNADEASALLGRTIRTEEEARAAAEDLVRAGARAVLLKGGHIDSGDRAVDWFATPRTVVPIARKRRVSPPLHGTGCTLSSLIAGRLAARVEGPPRAAATGGRSPDVARPAKASSVAKKAASHAQAKGASHARGDGPVTDEELLAAIRWARSALDRALRSPLAIGGGARVLDVRPRTHLERPR